MRLGLESIIDIKVETAFDLHKSRRFPTKSMLKIEIEPNDHRQNEDLGLKFPLEASKPKNTNSRTHNTDIYGKISKQIF